jgi:hypothetical protein
MGDTYVLLPIVKCRICRCDVAEVDGRGWCPGCVKAIADG